MARNLNRRRWRLAVLEQNDGNSDRRVSVPPNERRLSFGGKWSYPPAPEASNYVKLRDRYPLVINGKFVAPKSTTT